jgi:hypothetical protein
MLYVIGMIIVSIVAAALIGLVAGWLLHAWRVSPVEAAAAANGPSAELDAAQVRVEMLQSELEAVTANLREAREQLRTTPNPASGSSEADGEPQ